MVYLSYEREAFYGRENHELRITFDRNILWRTTQLGEAIRKQPKRTKCRDLADNQSGEIALEDEDGNTLVSYTPVREYNSVVISCAELSDGSTYTIHTGENSREVTMEGLVYTDGEVTNAPGQGGGQKPQGGPMGDNSGDSDNSDNSDRPTCRRDREIHRIRKTGNARRGTRHRAIRWIRQMSRRRRSLTVRNSRMVYIITRMRNPYSRSGFLLRLQICQHL